MIDQEVEALRLRAVTTPGETVEVPRALLLRILEHPFFECVECGDPDDDPHCSACARQCSDCNADLLCPSCDAPKIKERQEAETALAGGA